MNIKKFLAGAAASVMAVSAMTVAASAYNATIFFADADWYPSGRDEAHGVDITKNGTYTVTASYMGEDAETGGEMVISAEGVVVLCLDIDGLADALGIEEGSNTDNNPFTDVKLTVDGKDVAIDASKLVWGNIEGEGKLRLEIYNEYGTTKDNPPINTADVVGEEIAITFTFTGFEEDAAAPAETEAAAAPTGDANASAPAADKNNADTGVEGVAAIAGIAIVAAGAVVVAKKRK